MTLFRPLKEFLAIFNFKESGVRTIYFTNNSKTCLQKPCKFNLIIFIISWYHIQWILWGWTYFYLVFLAKQTTNVDKALGWCQLLNAIYVTSNKKSMLKHRINIFMVMRSAKWCRAPDGNPVQSRKPAFNSIVTTSSLFLYVIFD